MFYKLKNLSAKSGKGTVSCIIRTSAFETLKSTGVSVAPGDFNTATGKVSKRVKEHEELNTRIQQVAALMEQALTNCKVKAGEVTKVALETEIATLWEGYSAAQEKPAQEKKRVEKGKLLTDKIADFIAADVHHYRKATKRGYVDLKAMLSTYNPELTLRQVDITVFRSFQKWLIGKGLRNGSIRVIMQRFKAVYRFLADEAGLSSSFLDKLTVVPELANDEVIYLSGEEVAQLAALELNCKAQKQVRLQFLLACEVGLRHEDLVSLLPSNITGDTLTVVTRKKNITVKPPITAAARAILASDAFPFTAYHVNHYNKVLRTICKKLPAFNQEETLTHYVGNEPVQETKPKYLLISSHVGRKTAINNWLSKGVRESVVAQWAGHKNTKMIVKHYSNKEAAAQQEMSKLAL